MRRAGGLATLVVVSTMAACSAIVGDGSYRFPGPDATTGTPVEPSTDSGIAAVGPDAGSTVSPDAGTTAVGPDAASTEGGVAAPEGGPSPDGAPSDAGSEPTRDADSGEDASLVADAPSLDADGEASTTMGADGCGSEDCDDASCPTCGCDGGAFGPPELITGLGLDASLWAPTLTADGKLLYFGGVVGTQEQIYVATRSDDGPVFSQAAAVSSVNSSSSDGTPYVSQDGLTLYFYSTRPGGAGSRDVWMAQRTSLTSDFAPAAAMTALNSSSFDDGPWVSPDQLTLTFTSNRPGIGGLDVYIATRASLATGFSAPALLGGTAVNSTNNDDRAVLTRDGLTVYFASDRGNTNRIYDLWTATRNDVQSDFANPVKLQSLSTPGQDMNVFLSADETELYFSSDRSGTEQIWRSVWVCP